MLYEGSKLPHFFSVSLALFLAHYNCRMAVLELEMYLIFRFWQRLMSWLVAEALLAELISTNSINNMVSAYLKGSTVLMNSTWS